MADTAIKRGGGFAKSLPWLLTPLFLVVLSFGIVMLVYLLIPTHRLQNYLNIVEKEINTGGEQQTYDTGEIIYPRFGEQYAKLVCEDIDLTVGVYFGTTPELLALGACQSSQSKVLGDEGNVVISAHVNTFFADLSKMEVGDTVTLYTEYGVFTYEAAEAIRFEKENKQYVVNSKGDRLTLYTCEADVLGDSDMRIGMVCKPVDKQYYIPTEEKE